MKKKSFGKKLGKILFAICCIILAFAFWFIVKYNHLGGVALDLFKNC